MTLLLPLLAAVVHSTADRLNNITQLIEMAQKLAVALTVLVGTGFGGLAIAMRTTWKQVKRVERKVEPVQVIARQAQAETTQRDVEHESNTLRLDNIELQQIAVSNALMVMQQAVAKVVGDAAKTREAVADMHALVLRLVTKQAGI